MVSRQDLRPVRSFARSGGTLPKALYLDSVAGVAGDMFTAAFVDAGLVNINELNALVSQLGLDGIRIEAETVIRATVTATKVDVRIVGDDWKARFPGHGHGHAGHHHRDNTNLAVAEAVEHWHVHYPEIDKLVADSSLDEPVKRRAREIFAVIAEAEAGVHGVAIEKAAFHEVGTVDSVMDVVMAAYCINKIQADSVHATPLKPGRGTIKIAHGTHPVPPPASARLLVGMPITSTPAAITRENVELSTPTGIAILRSLKPEFVNEMPAGRLLAVGRGSGTMDLGGYPNIFQVALIQTSEESAGLPYATDTVVEIVFNVDDDTAEHMAWMAETLLEMGALDVWQMPGTGKKGRAMVCFSVLASESDGDALADWIMRKSTTFGLRYRTWDRLMLEREIDTRSEKGRDVRYKIGRTTAGEKLKEKIEFEDWKAARGDQ